LSFGRGSCWSERCESKQRHQEQAPRHTR
jgi:hypothetical protein